MIRSLIRSIGLSIFLIIVVSIAIGLASNRSVRAFGDSSGTRLLMPIIFAGAAANVLILGVLLRFLAGEVTRRTCTETSLRQSEEQFRGAFDAAACGMALVGTDGRWLRVNRALCEIVGYNEEELLATTFQAITPARIRGSCAKSRLGKPALRTCFCHSDDGFQR